MTSQDGCAAALFEAAIEISRDLRVPPPRLAPVLQKEIAKAYGVRADAPLPVILRTLQAWKPSTRVLADDGTLRIVSTECPILAQAKRDPGACRACQALQRELLATGLSRPLSSIRFAGTVVEGDPACEVRVGAAP